MNIMKKIILIAAMALMSVAAMAQDFKFGYVDFNELIMLMPEMDEARAALEENGTEYERKINAVNAKIKEMILNCFFIFFITSINRVSN